MDSSAQDNMEILNNLLVVGYSRHLSVYDTKRIGHINFNMSDRLRYIKVIYHNEL